VGYGKDMDRLPEEKGQRDDKDVPKTYPKFLKACMSFCPFCPTAAIILFPKFNTFCTYFK